jgi:RecB family exonuclease
MIDRLAGYLDETTPVLVEADFSLRVGRALLRGVVDRIEDAGDGAVRVADIKTGKTMATVAEATTNPQLGAYQLAVAEGALDLPGGAASVEARLVYVAQGAKAQIRKQPGLVPDEDGVTWAHSVVSDAAETMSGSRFDARENRLCPMCPVRRSCALTPEGQPVIP